MQTFTGRRLGTLDMDCRLQASRQFTGIGDGAGFAARGTVVRTTVRTVTVHSCGLIPVIESPAMQGFISRFC